MVLRYDFSSFFIVILDFQLGDITPCLRIVLSIDWRYDTSTLLPYVIIVLLPQREAL